MGSAFVPCEPILYSCVALFMLDMIIGLRYDSGILIKSFACEESRKFWETGASRRIPPSDIRSVAKRKLQMLDAAARLEDLRVPPGNRLEQLAGDRKGQHSIRINDQFRVCFVWNDGDAFDVEITDYH